jgi:uncharacterized membrane protein YqjE
MSQIVLIIWVAITFVVLVSVLLIRRRKKKSLKLELTEFISLTLAILGIISSCQLIYKAFTVKPLQDLLGADVVTLVIGGIAVIWVSAKEIWKLI